MINPKMYQKPVVGIGIAALVAVLCLAALASDSARIEKPAAVDAEQYADFIENEVFDIQDLAEGAEIQRRMFNRITPQGISWVQPMFPPVVPFDAENFDEKFLDELLGEDKNSVAIYPLSLALDPKTRETLVFNAEGKLIATIPTDRVSREWPEDADPARVTLQLDLLPAEDVEPYLYTESRIADYAETLTAKATKSGGMVLRSLGASEFGIAGVQRLTNGSMRITVTNGADTAEVYAYTVWHTSTVTTNEWVDEYGVTNIGTNTLWTPVSPPFNGIESEWECLTTNLALSGGVGVYEDANISSNARVRFYAVANRLDSDGDGLTDGAEIFIHRTDPGNPDTDGDGWSDTDELAEETDPLDRFSATTLARGVVLNEVLYDAAGTDLGKEWVELYSAGRYPVDVGGFVVQVADTAFSNAYVFPSNTWIDPGRFLLLGGSLVTNRDLEVDFTMPNRFTNDATAAVRLAAEVGTNTVVADCLMYGGNAANFNPNGLDTTGWISTNARSAGAGNSLYRLFAGHDTDQVLDWSWKSGPVPNSSSDIPDSDGDGLTDQEELTGSQNPYGEPTDRHNADSDGDGLSDYDECITYGTNPNAWATDGDIFPWPPPSGAVSNWWGSDPYELANGWDPLVFDENTNGIPDSWEMAFPGTNLYADADNDGISNYDELLQNSNPYDDESVAPQPYVLVYETTRPGWVNGDPANDIGLLGSVKVRFTGVKTNQSVCVWIKEGNVAEEFGAEWFYAEPSGSTSLSSQELLTGASISNNSYLLITDTGLHPEYTGYLGGEYDVQIVEIKITWDGIFSDAPISYLTNTVSVGHRIPLKTSVTPDTFTAHDFEWQVSGMAIEDYYVEDSYIPAEGHVVPLSNTTSSAIDFCWVDGNSASNAGVAYAVILNCKIYDVAYSTKALFDVKRPIACISVYTGATTILSDYTATDPILSFGDYTGYSTNIPGMRFNNTNLYSVWGYGGTDQCFWVQLIHERLSQQITRAGSPTASTNWGCDGNYPYGGFPGTHAEDCPRQGLTSNIVSADEYINASMYLMFKPIPLDESVESQAVPLSRIDWSWRGVATNINPAATNWNCITNWAVTLHLNNSTENIDTTDHPEWTKNCSE